MPLALSFPADRADPPRDLEVRPRAVKAWLDTLPMARTAEAGRDMAGHLSALNRCRLDLDDRVQILEAYRVPSATVLEGLEGAYAKAIVPLGPKPREALALARQLAGELATGYKIVIAEKAAKRIAFGARKQLPMLVLRALDGLAAQLRASYKSYTAVPTGLWHELHTLYLHAEQEGVEREPGDADSKRTPFESYTECLLLALTDPYRLVPGEADRVMAQIQSFRGVVTLGQSRPGTPAGGHFLVPCDTDRPPKPALSANDDTGGPNWRLLDANPLVEKLRLRKQAIEAGNVSATTVRAMGPEGLSLLGRLLVLWGDPPRRASRREREEATVAIVAGLRSLGHFLAQERLFAAGTEAALRKGITMPIPAHPHDEADQPIPVFEWDVVNRSDGGLKLSRTAPTPQAVAVGEVVGIKQVGRPRWSVGVARWITQLEEGGMEFGLQFLAAEARAVWVQPTIAAQPQAKAALLLPGGAGSGGMLLAPANTWSELREFEVDDAGTVVRVRATALIEKSARFELFHVALS